MIYNTTQVNVKYQVVIPKEVRRFVIIEPKEKLGVFYQDNDTIILKKLPNSIKDLRGSYKFSHNYLEKERLSW